MSGAQKKEADVVEVQPTEEEAQRILEEQARKRAAECDSKIQALLKTMDCHFRVLTIREGSQSVCQVIAVPNARKQA